MKLFKLAVLALAAVCTLSAQEKLVPFKTDLPKPKRSGTPVAVRVPNLESAAEANRAPVMIPEGSVNLAAGKPVTSSDSFPVVGMLEQITDGEKDSDDGYFVELGDGKQWIQIDLEESANIAAIAVWHFHAQERAYLDVVVQISDDPDFISGVTTVFNNDEDNSSGLGIGKDKVYVETNKGRVIPVKNVTGRYVRLYSRGNSANQANHYIEVEVWGKPAA